LTAKVDINDLSHNVIYTFIIHFLIKPVCCNKHTVIKIIKFHV